ncbi:MAG: hypothetical protein JXQ96_04925 [Cyclobacteriaceae bacterium]
MFGFSSKKEKAKKKLAKSHINSLYEMLLADGKTHQNELKMLHERAKFHKLTPKEVDEIIANNDGISANKEDLSFIKPETIEERFHFIYDLTYMMMVDGDIDYREKEMCKDYAVKLGYDMSIVEDLVEKISANVGAGNDLNESYRRLYSLIREK